MLPVEFSLRVARCPSFLDRILALCRALLDIAHDLLDRYKN